MTEHRWKKRDIQRGCAGAVHVIPVPRWMTPEEAWAVTCVEGRLPVPDSHDGDELTYDHASTLAVEAWLHP